MQKDYKKPIIENIEFDDVITTSDLDWQDNMEIIQPGDWGDWSSDY